MEIRDLRERDFETIEAQPEWHRFPGTAFELQMVELTPEEWDKIVKKCTGRKWDKKARAHVERLDGRKSTEAAYRIAIVGCKGLTPKVVKEALKLTWPFPDDENEEITFSSITIMHDFLWNCGRKSARLNKFIVEKILPDASTIEEEEEVYEGEKKIS